MIIPEYSRYDGLGLAELVRRREVSPVDLVDSALDAIERLNPQVNCVVQQLRAEALREIKRGLPTGPFHGVPFRGSTMEVTLKGVPRSPFAMLWLGFSNTTTTIGSLPIDLGLLLGPADPATARASGSGAGIKVTAAVPQQSLPFLAARLDQSMPVGNEGDRKSTRLNSSHT